MDTSSQWFTDKFLGIQADFHSFNDRVDSLEFKVDFLFDLLIVGIIIAFVAVVLKSTFGDKKNGGKQTDEQSLREQLAEAQTTNANLRQELVVADVKNQLLTEQLILSRKDNKLLLEAVVNRLNQQADETGDGSDITETTDGGASISEAQRH